MKKTTYHCAECDRQVDADRPVVMSTEQPDDSNIMVSEQDAHSRDEGAEFWNEHLAHSRAEGLGDSQSPASSTVNVLRVGESPTRHNIDLADLPPDSVAARWMAAAPLIDGPPPVELAPVRESLRDADLAATSDELRRANGALATRLDDVARTRGRQPAPKPGQRPLIAGAALQE